MSKPTGAILSPIPAQYIMDRLLKSCLVYLPFKVIFCRKFVDDLILAVHVDYYADVLATFDSYHDTLKFTMKKENNISVPFLDSPCRQAGIFRSTPPPMEDETKCDFELDDNIQQTFS
ncbi:hypothetical protein HHI36_001139 [Cryptolaemus montrouzieri]|uniref:Reverse transcriptase domain-containing protein n=1 Tax=Cryptolaemus montrouzieri TaxID=559131 RepID=A0ABD2P832_9CUCU